jgi:hypothetical protein
MTIRKKVLFFGIAIFAALAVFLRIRSARENRAERGTAEANAEAQLELTKSFKSPFFTSNSPLSLLVAHNALHGNTNLSGAQRINYIQMLALLIETYQDGGFQKYLNFKKSFGDAQLGIPAGNEIAECSIEDLERIWNSKSAAFIAILAGSSNALPETFKLRITKFDPKSLVCDVRTTVVGESGLDRMLRGKQFNGMGRIENRYFRYNRGPTQIIEENGHIKWVNVAFTCYTDLAELPGYVAISSYWDPVRLQWVPYEMLSCSPPNLFLMF